MQNEEIRKIEARILEMMNIWKLSDIIRSTVPNVHKIFEKWYGDKMNYCDLNEYEDYIENIEFFLKEKCLQICIINSELKNRKKIYIKDIEEIYWEKYFFDQQENRKIKSMCDEISYSLVASESKLITIKT